MNVNAPAYEIQFIQLSDRPDIKSRNPKLILALSALILAAAACGFSQTGVFHLLSIWAQDTNFRARSRQQPVPILLIQGDQKALNTFPELMMFWHRYYAEAIRAAAESGAQVIGFDVVSSIGIDKYEPGADELLAQAIVESPIPVICASRPENASQSANRVNMVASALGLDALASLNYDPDGVIRRQELIEAPSQSSADLQPRRSMALSIAERFLRADAVFNNGKLLLNGHPIPIDSDRSIIINFTVPPNQFQVVSLADFITAYRGGNRNMLRDWVRGKAVLIGLDTLNDRFAIPIRRSFLGLPERASEVGIHASTLRTLLEREYLVGVPRWLHYGAVLLILASTILLAAKLRIALVIGSSVVELAIILIGTHLLFRIGWILSSAELVLSFGVSLMVGIACRLLKSTKGSSSAESVPT